MIDHKLSRHFSRVKAMWLKQQLPFELWLGRGKPLNPYLRGHLISICWERMKPRELKLIPEEFFGAPQVKEFSEYTQTRGWVHQWLKYLQWYCEIALSSEVTIPQFFDAPVVITTWKVLRRDENLSRFGLLWEVYDIVACWGLDFKVPILESKPILFNGYICGGMAPSQNFIVSAAGLYQPAAGRGIVFPGINRYPGDKPHLTMNYKTLGVSDRQSGMGY